MPHGFLDSIKEKIESTLHKGSHDSNRRSSQENDDSLNPNKDQSRYDSGSNRDEQQNRMGNSQDSGMSSNQNTGDAGLWQPAAIWPAAWPAGPRVPAAEHQPEQRLWPAGTPRPAAGWYDAAAGPAWSAELPRTEKPLTQAAASFLFPFRFLFFSPRCEVLSFNITVSSIQGM
ncbi:hypothetical protein GQ54DRAFT_169142 [Martensiomyces pterosporus]|nr:hypothetical protein GQ54DRAFT_169142 [Martensiomyces pterosporus]